MAHGHFLKIETAGIQKYIFGSNKLKVNLGASYIIEHLLFKDLLKEAVEISSDNAVGHQQIIDNWFESSYNSICSIEDEDFGIVYIGGGNAVLEGDEELLEKLANSFKSLVLQCFPGMEVYSGIVKNNGHYKDVMNSLSNNLNENRSAKSFTNFILNHGFYNKCGVTGGVATHYWETEKIWVSDEVMSKVNQTEGENEANKKHELDLLDDEQKEKYSFPLNFEQLSSSVDKAYIAVVHIDGNNLGQAFIDANDIGKTRELSLKVRSIGTKALKDTIKEGIIDLIENKNTKEFFLLTRKDKQKYYLPIRPLITGGDDITFVCEGTLGIPLAKLFLKKFHAIGKELNLLDGDVHACAGVAIVKQKYPFYRAYQLSEELIKEAKELSRGNSGSYLAAMVAGYGTGISIEDLKNKYAKPELYKKAYQVEGKNSEATQMKSLESLIAKFSEERDGKKVIPRNRLMDVRQALVTNQIDAVWPVVESRIGDKGFDPITEPALVFEAIELMDFYHEAFITAKKLTYETI